MTELYTTRRRFMLTSLAFSGLAVTGTSFIRASAAWANSGDDEALTHFARLLFPHDGVTDAVYAEAMASVLAGFEANPETDGLLDSAEAALNAQQDEAWFDLDETTQISAIKSIQGEAFFVAILGALRGAFYYHPAVWEHLDYPGSSKEHGGYLHRGFNDISWLPESN
jgi:hypothetical protein